MNASEESARNTTSAARNRRRSSTRSIVRPASTYQTPSALQASPNALKAQRAGAASIHRQATRPHATIASHASACHHDGLKSSSNSDAANRQNTRGLPMPNMRSGSSESGGTGAKNEAETMVEAAAPAAKK